MRTYNRIPNGTLVKTVNGIKIYRRKLGSFSTYVAIYPDNTSVQGELHKLVTDAKRDTRFIAVKNQSTKEVRLSKNEIKFALDLLPTSKEYGRVINVLKKVLGRYE